MSTTDSATPVVSVCMITYNHERFIAQAIESVLMQETDFPVELVIGEDCSTDGTRTIVTWYAQQYPDRIRAVLHERNLGMNSNFVAAMKACRGQYVALLEGDDYWTEPSKLQRQVEFLDTHPECAICFHDVSIVDEDGRQQAAHYCPPDQKEISTIEDVLVSSFIPTCSTMFRNRLFGDFPSWYHTLELGDRPHLVLNAQYGDIGYINSVMAAYRVHSRGSWSAMQLERRLAAIFRMYDVLDAHLEGRYSRAIARGKRACIADFLVRRIQGIGTLDAGEFDAKQTLQRWQSELKFSPWWGRRALGYVYAHYLFDAHAKSDWPTARRSFLRLITSDPTWLRNLGVCSIGLKAFVGPRVAEQLRRVINRLDLSHGNKPA